MALSNKFGSMLLSTGNKSELAVGYCTLYGDMAGGLAVISDVPKLMVYELARKMEAGLAVSSVVGQGSTFTLLLAVSEVEVIPVADTTGNNDKRPPLPQPPPSGGREGEARSEVAAFGAAAANHVSSSAASDRKEDEMEKELK